MSADNGVYILGSKRSFVELTPGTYSRVKEYDVYRVAYTQGFDSFYWYNNNQPYNTGSFLYEVFKDSPVFMSAEDALHYASKLAEEVDYLEYGITVVDTSMLGKNFMMFGDL
jgi:hypothetical protein